jgi:pyruvate/2-oxoglutarate dehydrogenase complex dihydrolipoamide dehydrogenase (E3) component
MASTLTSERIVVVGAGPAGLMAASAAAGAGASVLLLEERPQAGGQLLYRVQPVESASGLPAERPDQLAERLVADALAAGVELRSSALVAGAFPGNELFIVEQDRGWRTTADAVVITTGSTDLPFPFPGWTFPGVFSGRALQILLNQWWVRPGKRCAIVGEGPAADELAVDILLAGGEVVWSGIVPAPFLRVEGEDGVRALVAGAQRVEVDIVVIAVGRQADATLATMCGVPLGFAAELGGLVPLVGDRLQAEGSTMFVAGDAAGIGSVAAAIAEGRLAGVAAAASLGLAREEDVVTARDRGGAELAWRLNERSRLQAAHRQPFE